MFSVIFEVKRKQDHLDEYLDLAKELKPMLEQIDGFIDNERFENRTRPGWLLSHSTWRDEKAVVRWRTVGRHHEVQARGREAVFDDYHLRVGDVVADSAPPADAPIHELRFDETAVGAAKYASLTELTPDARAEFQGDPELAPAHLGLQPGADGLVEHSVFASINNPGKLAVLASWRTADCARTWSPRPFAGVKALRHRLVRVVRDYGMFDRREAPQYYPDA